MNGMAIEKLRHECEESEFEADIYQLFNGLSSKPPKRIEGFRMRVHKEIDEKVDNFKDAKKMHVFTDLLVDSCIKAATLREKSRQEDSHTEPTLTAMSERITPRQDDSISYRA